MVVGGMLFPRVTATNCGGNSAALTAVHSYVSMTIVAAMDNPDRAFNPMAMTPDQRSQISNLPGASSNRHTHLLISKIPFVPRSSEPRRVVIVCDTPYTNVPQRPSPPTHAAGFSDGTTGLISPKEFAALDHSTFVAIDELFPAEKRPTETAEHAPQQNVYKPPALPLSNNQP